MTVINHESTVTQTMMNRRDFLLGSVAVIEASVLPLRAELAKGRPVANNLIPSEPNNSPNYWCTWATQNYICGHGADRRDVRLLEGNAGAQLAREAINEQLLLGDNGWARVFFPNVRKDLYLLLDDGWQEGGSATFMLDRSKFPSFRGAPEVRLRKLNDAICRMGWRGLALWCRHTPENEGCDHLVAWSKEAGIHYWKVDGGDLSYNLERARNVQHAALKLEHVYGEPPLNGDWHRDGRFGNQPWGSPRMEIIRHADVYRTYDTTALLSIPTTLDRVSELLQGASGHGEIRAILNVEDEVYIAAVLGCTMGVMRNPLTGSRPGKDVDLFDSGPRHLKRCIDEVARAIRWQRIAAPYAVGDGFVRLDDEIFTDDWVFNCGETWFIPAIGNRANQSAPARISRNLELPEVRCAGDKPFVFTARFPSGAAAIGAHGRLSIDGGWRVPKPDVRWKLDNSPGPFAIFGYFSSVALVFDQPIGKTRILAQDLAAEKAYDISESVQSRGSEVVIPQGVIERLGLEGSSPGDQSAPGLLIQLNGNGQ